MLRKPKSDRPDRAGRRHACRPRRHPVESIAPRLRPNGTRFGKTALNELLPHLLIERVAVRLRMTREKKRMRGRPRSRHAGHTVHKSNGLVRSEAEEFRFGDRDRLVRPEENPKAPRQHLKRDWAKPAGTPREDMPREPSLIGTRNPVHMPMTLQNLAIDAPSCELGRLRETPIERSNYSLMKPVQPRQGTLDWRRIVAAFGGEAKERECGQGGGHLFSLVMAVRNTRARNGRYRAERATNGQSVAPFNAKAK